MFGEHNTRGTEFPFTFHPSLEICCFIQSTSLMSALRSVDLIKSNFFIYSVIKYMRPIQIFLWILKGVLGCEKSSQ